MRSRLVGVTVASVLALVVGLGARSATNRLAAAGRQSGNAAWHTSGVLSRVGIEKLPVGCQSAGKPTAAAPWTSASGDAKCSTATEQSNVDGLMVLVNWSTLQPDRFDEPLSSYYIDNAIYSLAHPERQSIHLAVLAGVHSPGWLVGAAGPSDSSFADAFSSGRCDPSAGGPTPAGAPGRIWNTFSFKGKPLPMPNPFGSNTCLFTALDNLVAKLGQTGDYHRPTSPPFPPPLAPYDNLYYDAAPGHAGFVHAAQPTPTMHKVIGHVSVLGPHSYDAESVLCEDEADCESVTANPANAANYHLWQSLAPDDAAMESAIESAQEKAIDIYATRFPNTFWTVDVVERAMPFFSPDGAGCKVKGNRYPPTGRGGTNDSSDCFGLLRNNLIAYIQTHYPARGGVQNNSLGPNPRGVTTHPVWRQVALAAQGPPTNPVKLFTGLQVGAPVGFYGRGRGSFRDLQQDVQSAVDLAKQMLPGYGPVDFIEFYDVDIAGTQSVPEVDGRPSPRSRSVNMPPSAINDAPDGVTSGGFMFAPLTDAHRSLGGPPATRIAHSGR